MPSQDPTVTAWRFVYGKLVREPGGPVIPGFEHRPTSISQGLPAGLLPFCRPQEILGNQSVQALVHPQREDEGALCFRPVCRGLRRYMLATCVRARPESGLGGLSRTHTQLVTFVFSEADWNSQAPRLLANAGRWLRAEPDTVAFHEQYRDHGDYPPVVLGPEALTQIPPGASGPLPKAGSLLWRLAGAVAKADDNLVCGAAERIDSVGTFLRALAGALALLPEPLRIYLTAAAGFAEAQEAFALQYLPQAPALAPAEPGLLEQLAGELLGQDPAADQESWQRSWRPDPERARCLRALATPAGWRTAAEARRYLTLILDHLMARRSLTHLAAWLDGTRSEPPARPARQHRNAGRHWVLTLTQRINEAGTGPPGGGPARALVRIATLIDTDGASSARQQEQAAYWSHAWRAAAACVGSPRSVLRWSALSTSRLADDPEDAAPHAIGWLKDFGELRVLTEALQRAKAASPAHIALIDRTLGNQAFDRRLADLRRRANDMLIRRPRAIIDLAASFPALLAPRPGDDARHAEHLAETVRMILVAARLYAWTAEDVPEGQQALAAAAQQVAERSLQIRRGDDDLRCDVAQHAQGYCTALLRRYWQWALAADADRDHACTLWHDAVVLAFYLQVRENGLTGPLRLLFDACRQRLEEAADALPDPTRLKSLAAALFDRCLARVDDLGTGPVQTAADLFCSLPDLPALAPPPDDQFVTCQLAEALNRGLCRALRDQGAGPSALIDDFLPVFSDAMADWLADPANEPTPRLTRRLLALASLVLERLLQTGGPLPRAVLTELFDRLELFVSWTPAYTVDLVDAIGPLVSALARCILGWAEADPPEPWLDSGVPLAQAPMRWALAQRLGYPRCAYFAALTPVNHRDPRVWGIQALLPKSQPGPAVAALGLPPEAAGAVAKVLAAGAARTWRSLFAQGRAAPDALQPLFDDPATDEALDALVALAQSENPAYRRLIDDETWFTVAFFAGLGQAHAPLGHWPMPESLRAALLSDGTRHHECYALQLGRRIATAPSWIGGHLKVLFAHDQSGSLIARRVLLLGDHGWDDFSRITPAARRHGLLRLLFLLGLILEVGRRPETRPVRCEITARERMRALLIGPEARAIKGALDAFFEHNPDFATAFQRAIAAAHIPCLTGWPERVQPFPRPPSG